MSGRVAVLVLCFGFVSAAAVFCESVDPQQPEFVKGEASCLRLQVGDETYSKESLAAAQYRWLAESYPGYRFKEHGKPKPPSAFSRHHTVVPNFLWPFAVRDSQAALCQKWNVGPREAIAPPLRIAPNEQDSCRAGAPRPEKQPSAMNAGHS